MSVEKLPGAPDPINVPVQSTVELLEELLVKAKQGDVRSIAIAYTDAAGGCQTRWINNHEFYKLMGCVSQLTFNMGEV